jgi:two-component system OmpR family response regulator
MIKSLIVEDNAEFRAFLRALLLERFPDGSVDEARDALQALRLLGEGKHDIVLLDIGLPGAMNGLTLITRIRQNGRRPPILIISNYVLPEYQLEAARLGADWFLPKVGASSQEILAAIERLTMI